MAVTIHFDGSCQDNPCGPMGYGCLIKIFRHNTNKDVIEDVDYGGEPESSQNTNNVAEYKGLILGLQMLESYKIKNDHVTIFGDSMLVIKQMMGKWRIKEGKYVYDAKTAQKLIKKLKEENGLKFTFKWIPREQNLDADELSNMYYDGL